MDSKQPTGPHQFSMPNWISCAPFESLLAMEIVRADRGEALLKMPFLKSFAQGSGLMHGGALVSLADTAVVMAIKSILAPGTHFATTSLESRFLHPVKKGVLTARAKIVGSEGAVLKGTCDIMDEDDRVVMTFTSIFKIAKNAQIKTVRFGEAP